jgi:hypothetical protein
MNDSENFLVKKCLKYVSQCAVLIISKLVSNPGGGLPVNEGLCIL